MNSILNRCRDNGLLLGKGGNFGHVFRIKPPMCITIEVQILLLMFLKMLFEKDFK